MPTRRRSSGGDGGPAGEQEQPQEEAVTNIKVAVRCRPFSTSERSRGERSCFRIENGTACLENPANPADIHRWALSQLGRGFRGRLYNSIEGWLTSRNKQQPKYMFQILITHEQQVEGSKC